jgi:uncharacterized membrane-anchored protein YhcB (DUF1043 family)
MEAVFVLVGMAIGCVPLVVHNELIKRNYQAELEKVKENYEAEVKTLKEQFEASQPEIVSRMALRRQVGEAYLDIDFHIYKGESDKAIVKKTEKAFNLSGTAYELIKKEMELEIEKKRAAAKKVQNVRN